MSAFVHIDGVCPPGCLCKLAVCVICNGAHPTAAHRPATLKPDACHACKGSRKVAGQPCPMCADD